MNLAYSPRHLFERPALYRLLGRLVGRTRQWPIFTDEYVRASPGNRILDIGCGAADLLTRLPDSATYVGFDSNPRCIRAARSRFGTRGTFECRTVDRRAVADLGDGSFDIVVAHGVLHHLDDGAALEFFALARAALRPQGRLVTGDGCYQPGQPWAVRRLLAWDRGQHVRSESGYVALAAQHFRLVHADLRSDTAFVPYTMVYLTCTA